MPGTLYCSEECAQLVKKDREENKRQKRRSITKEYGRQSVRLNSVYEDAGGVCAICGLPVPVSVDENDMWSATRDHIVPLTLGGSHNYQNCQLAHRICNSCKGKSSDYKIDWGEKMESEPGKWEEKFEYLLETLGKESSRAEAV